MKQIPQPFYKGNFLTIDPLFGKWVKDKKFVCTDIFETPHSESGWSFTIKEYPRSLDSNWVIEIG